MPLQINGTTVGEARYARGDGSLATVGEARVWQGGRWKTIYESWKPRTVTIRTTSVGWNVSTASGDEDLIQSLTPSGVTFVEDVVCDNTMRTTNNVSPGTRIPAGTSISPSSALPAGRTCTFTSVR